MIRKTDRVSTVLGGDESLIDVFIALSPAFERLRNPAMRKVMSRLVTVEQAAKMAGVNADVLVARLNTPGAAAVPDAGAEHVQRTAAPSATAAGSPVTAMAASPVKAAAGDATVMAPVTAVAATAVVPTAAGPALRAVPDDAIVELDVREDLRNGQEPFSRIMAARGRVPVGGALRIRAIFEPVPLYAVMEKQGFAHHTEQHAPDDWSVWFYPAVAAPSVGDDDAASSSAAAHSARAATDDATDDASDDASDDGVVVLDVRDLEPPEPMVRTLAALAELPPGGTLVQLNVRVPQFLLPQLEERGFTYEIREQSPELVRLFITRNPAKA
jgi:uncharacterized protein (DUF2249 family)